MACTWGETRPFSPSLLQTQQLQQIAVDYTSEVSEHNADAGEIVISFERAGQDTMAKPPQICRRHIQRTHQWGNTSGLNYNIYLSSLEGDNCQDEIDFKFLGNDRCTVQTNHFTAGIGNPELCNLLDFDSSLEFHEYTIRWSPLHRIIEWFV
ncbi:hypothetical protein L7F22_041200 [Adiantum nelumboides]|nr:hypothetical protein [Adiantum nelumboides]